MTTHARVVPRRRSTSAGRLVVAFLSAALVTLGFASSLPADPGDLDLTFNGTGKVLTDFGRTDVAAAIAIQPDGKIVVAGRSGAIDSFDFAVARYKVNGTLDLDFGCPTPGSCTGKVVTDFGADDEGGGVAMQADGKIVVAGRSGATGSFDFAAARYNVNGTLDPDFGCPVPGSCTGKVLTDLGGNDWGTAVAIQPDGKIVVAGYSSTSGFALARYTPSGILDPDFGCPVPGSCPGTVLVDFGSFEQGQALALQVDGKIVVAGGAFPSGSSILDFAVARYHANGSVDTDFGCLTPGTCPGIVYTDFPGSLSDFADAVAIQPDGKIVAAGTSTGSGFNDFALARYTANGILDRDFGCPTPGSCTGKVVSDFGGNDQAHALAIEADGKLVAAGFSGTSGSFDFVVARYNRNGTPDTQFGCPTPGSCTGMLLTDFGSDDAAFAIAIQADGKLVVGGRSGDPGTGVIDFAVARYQGGFLAGTPGQSDCQGESVSALTQQYGSLPAAASALGFSSVKALQDAIRRHCGQ